MTRIEIDATEVPKIAEGCARALFVELASTANQSLEGKNLSYSQKMQVLHAIFNGAFNFFGETYFGLVEQHTTAPDGAAKH